MTFASKITKGIIKKTIDVTLFGPPGVGKSSWAASFPSPIFITTEEGTNQLDVARFPVPATFKDVLDMLKEIPGEYKTLAIDSLDHLEPLIWRAVVEEAKKPGEIDTIEDFGYGKGYVLALEKWKQFFNEIKKVRDSGKNIIHICHSQVKTINDPRQPQPYDRHELKLNKSAAALVKESVDAILFATFEVHVKTEKSGKGKAFGEGNRVLYTEGRPAHEGKNRYGLPYQIPLSYEAFMEAYNKADPSNAAALVEIIKGKIAALPDETKKVAAQKFLNEAGHEMGKLLSIQNRLDILLGGKVA